MFTGGIAPNRKKQKRDSTRGLENSSKQIRRGDEGGGLGHVGAG
jgi:hypothetical protein